MAKVEPLDSALKDVMMLKRPQRFVEVFIKKANFLVYTKKKDVKFQNKSVYSSPEVQRLMTQLRNLDRNWNIKPTALTAAVLQVGQDPILWSIKQRHNFCTVDGLTVQLAFCICCLDIFSKCEPRDTMRRYVCLNCCFRGYWGALGTPKGSLEIPRYSGGIPWRLAAQQFACEPCE